MKFFLLGSLILSGWLTATFSWTTAMQPEVPEAPQAKPDYNAGPVNPSIDMNGYLVNAQHAAEHRTSRRLTEEQFLQMSLENGTIVLDARSSEMYELLHVKGAINLSFPDISIESLACMVPDKSTRILIYCNNNFVGNPFAFPSKNNTVSLNLSTYATLYNYGYRNIYELGPLVHVDQTKLKLVSTKECNETLRGVSVTRDTASSSYQPNSVYPKP
jgi:phage shock protein E